MSGYCSPEENDSLQSGTNIIAGVLKKKKKTEKKDKKEKKKKETSQNVWVSVVLVSSIIEADVEISSGILGSLYHHSFMIAEVVFPYNYLQL